MCSSDLSEGRSWAPGGERRAAAAGGEAELARLRPWRRAAMEADGRRGERRGAACGAGVARLGFRGWGPGWALGPVSAAIPKGFFFFAGIKKQF